MTTAIVVLASASAFFWFWACDRAERGLKNYDLLLPVLSFQSLFAAGILALVKLLETP